MHRRKLLKKALAAFLVVNLIVTSSSMAFAGNNDNNSADVNYESETTDTGSRYVATGYRQLDEEYQIIPDVLSNDNSSIDGMEITKAATYPAAYRTENLPAVRDQGIYGVCWSFSTISLIETNLIKKNLASSDIDLSELHLVNYTYNCVNDPLGGLEGDVNKFDTSYGSVMQYGGNVEMAANSLLDWEGAVNEDVVPYTIDYIRQVENEQLDDSLAYGKDVAHVQNFYRVNITSRDDVKKAVMDYGAVSISYYSDKSSDWSTDNYNSSTAAYYCPNAYTSNHAVTIVGWDDDYSADNFATTPDGNGAWIVRNSWGSYYGKEGYFYLSYYDKSIYTVGYALEAELSDNYDNNYQYDGAMLYGYMGYGGSNNKYANIFEAKANQDGSENIKAVSFMTGRSTNLNYTVSIYTNLTDETNPESGTLAAQKSGITTYDGTYTVNLDSPVEINEGNKFSVVVEVRNDSGKTPYLAYERSMQSGRAGYWCTASAKENQSFIATPYGYWDDFGKARSCNFIIKAFTDNETQTPVVEVESVSLNKSEMTLTEGESETLAATVTPDNAENKSIIWSSNNEAVATVDANGTVTAKRAGTAVITATSTNGKSAGCTVTVEKKQIPVTEVRLSESTVGIVEGSTYKLTATVLPENTTDSKSVSWSSNNSAVATVDANGTVTAKSAGTAVITATSTNGKSAGCTVTVEKKQIPVTEVRLSESTVGIVEGSTYKLTATVLPENTTDSKSVSWSSNNSAVATVDANGTVTAKRAGTAVITATSTNGKTAGCTVTVSKKEIPITEISLDKSSATLTEGETTTLTATVLPENTTYGKSVKWSSSNVAVATVDIMGKVTAKSAGTAIITAISENGKTASCTITVNKKDTNITITEVRLNKSTETLTEGETTTLVATVLPENTTDSKSVSWRSSNSEVATVDANGTVTAKRTGTAVITATSTNGKTAGCTVTVSRKEIPITEISLDKSSATLTEGETTTLVATVLPENTTDSKSVSWSSSNSEVAKVDANGTVTAKRAGTAVITATSTNGKTAGCTVTVSKKEIPITEISLDKSSATLTEGETTTLTATVLPENTTYGKSVKWSSSNVAVAIVDLMGKVTAKSAGTAVITATSENGKTASCTVTVNKKDTYTGLRDVDGNWMYFENGNVNSDYVGLVNYEGLWFYVDNGTIDWGYTGLADYNGIWFYVSGGMVDWNYAGLTYYNDVWFYVSGGMINWDYTGLVYYNDIWFYVSGGILDWDYIGLTYYNDIWFVISGGMINWDYAGLIYYNDMWFYVSGGTINWDYAGLIYYNDAWFYVSGGCINWTTAIVDYNGAKFYVQNGMVDWDYTGTVNYNGSTYNVISGMVY